MLIKAFTLSEVLVTLGIIAVVASMTIPQVINKYQKSVIETNLKKTYTELAQVIKRSEVDNDDYTAWDYGLHPDTFINKYIAPYISLTSCNDVELCFEKHGPSNVRTWQKPDGNWETDGKYLTTMRKFLLKDGRSIGIMNQHTAGHNWRYVEFVVDTNGQRGRTVMGEDVFRFCLMDYTYGIHYTGFHLGGCQHGGIKNKNRSETLNRNSCKTDGSYCEYFIEQNNWKFPNDYPLKF